LLEDEKLLRPVFINKEDRKTIKDQLEEEKAEKAFKEQEKKYKEEKKQETKKIVYTLITLT